MSEDAADGAIVREVVEGGTLCRSKDDEVGMQLGGCREDFDRGMAVSDARFHIAAAGFVCSNLGCENAKLAHGGGIEARGQVFAPHFLERRQHMEQNEFCLMA